MKAVISLGFIGIGVVLLVDAVRGRQNWDRYSDTPIEPRWWHLSERYLSYTSERDFVKEGTIAEALAGVVAIALGVVGLVVDT